MRKIIIPLLCLLFIAVMCACEQEIALLNSVSGSDFFSATPLTEKDSATHILITAEDSSLYGTVSPYFGTYAYDSGDVYVCSDGYISATDALRVNKVPSESDLIPAESLWIRSGDSTKLRLSPSQDSESVSILPNGAIFAVSAVSCTDSLYYSVVSDGNKGYVSSAAADVSSDRSELDFYAVMDKYTPVGAQIAIIESGEIKGVYSYGLADKKQGIAMTNDTKIRVASLTKVILGICAMKMDEEGIIDIDENIGKYWGNEKLANSRYPDEKITMRSILTHTSSISSVSDYPGREKLEKQIAGSSLFGKKKPNTANAWYYNNFAIGVGGCTMEAAAEKNLNDYAIEKLFEPMSIEAAYSLADLPEGSPAAVLYFENGKKSRTKKDDETSFSDLVGDNCPLFAGNVHISAEDYAKIMLMLMNDGTYEGTAILSPESVAEMEKGYFEIDDSESEFTQCLILRKRQLYNRNLYYHTGNAYGTIALTSYDPETMDGVVIVTTGMGLSKDKDGIYSVCGEITKRVYKNIDEKRGAGE